MGIDVYWRFCLVGAVKKHNPKEILDLATGSGDVAFALKRGLQPETRVLGVDFCLPMIEEADIKLAAHPGLSRGLEFRQGDALALALQDSSFDAVTIAFGFRNMQDRALCLAEIRRVLRPGGWLFILEFSKPWRFMRPLYDFHLRHFVPVVAGWLTGDRSAYDYLCGSIEAFPDRTTLSHEIRAGGFEEVSSDALSTGIVAIHSARKPD
jgi:demethylmenaquinone methyltransferase / 2-methoxy-6-polyprenyl-1,4-benzoquinol methylase